MTLKPHPYAEIFPMMEGEAFAAFAADMKENGQREKIVLLDGMILDGRNRYKAAELHDLPAAQGDAECFREFDPAQDGDALKWVISLNVNRRHMDETQRAMVAARLANMRQGERTDVEPSANLRKVDQETAAGALNVSTRSVQSARLLLEKGAPELVRAADHGKIAVSAAASAATRLTPEKQAEVAKQAEAGKSNAARTMIKQGERNAREEALGKKQCALPDKQYGVILADPEHQFEVWSRETGLDRSADNHYPTSELRLIMMRQVVKIAAKDAMLALWVTDLANGLRIMESWGFTFKSYRVWAKDFIPSGKDDFGRDTFTRVGAAGTGYWFRDEDELLLIGTRGDFVAPAMGTQPGSILFAARPKEEDKDRGKHSAKPAEVMEWVEANWPHLPKIELNARKARDGWDCWGNEAPVGSNAAAATRSENQPDPSTEEAVAPGKLRPKEEILATARPGARWSGPGSHLSEPLDSVQPGIPTPQTQASNAEVVTEARALVIQHQKGSASMLQRMLQHHHLSYSDAYAILDMLEQQGVVSKPDEKGGREVLIDRPAPAETNMSAPATPAAVQGHAAKDEFEIPAFLRRQSEK